MADGVLEDEHFEDRPRGIARVVYSDSANSKPTVSRRSFSTVSEPAGPEVTLLGTSADVQVSMHETLHCVEEKNEQGGQEESLRKIRPWVTDRARDSRVMKPQAVYPQRQVDLPCNCGPTETAVKEHPT